MHTAATKPAAATPQTRLMARMSNPGKDLHGHFKACEVLPPVSAPLRLRSIGRGPHGRKGRRRRKKTLRGTAGRGRKRRARSLPPASSSCAGRAWEAARSGILHPNTCFAACPGQRVGARTWANEPTTNKPTAASGNRKRQCQFRGSQLKRVS